MGIHGYDCIQSDVCTPPKMEKYKRKILSKVGHVWNILAHRICHLINSFRCEEGCTVPPNRGSLLVWLSTLRQPS